LFSLFFLTRCSGVVGESGLPGDPISGDGGSGDSGGGASGLGGTIVTGSGGGPGGSTGGAGAGAGGGTVASGLPCDVQALLQTRCVMCHASPPVNGAPMPLVNFAHLIAASFVDPTKTFAQRALVRIQARARPRPRSRRWATGSPAATRARAAARVPVA
jgi:hypothetical protein